MGNCMVIGAKGAFLYAHWHPRNFPSTGSEKHTFTVTGSNLTVTDSGKYECVYHAKHN